MKIISDPKKFQNEMERLRLKGKTIGFVPTMGALHEGHVSLVRRSRKENDVTAVSIFVNPLQFGPGEDFNKYPRVMKQDSALLRKEKADYVFCPAKETLYPEAFFTSVEVARLGEGLCGKFRPGHFRGVTTVVAKLFHITKPHRVYFGAKDYQQASLIRRMIQDLNWDIEFRLCPTVREKDGLAMSSRNRYLSPRDRKRAAVIPRRLFELRDRLAAGEKNLKQLKSDALKKLSLEVDQVQYLEIVDPLSLESLSKAQAWMTVLTACTVGKTRLIDNVIISPAKR